MHKPTDDAPRLFETPANPCPPGAETSWVRVRDGVRLRVATWPVNNARGTVIVLQGRTEFIEKYFETIGDLLARGFAVVAFDWRGQGGSDRLLPRALKGHVGSFSDYLADLGAVLESVGATCPKPWVALSHSMGGLTALQALMAHPGLFARVVLSAPMTSIRLRHRGAIAALARIMPKRSFVPGGAAFNPATEPFEGNRVTHDRARFMRTRSVLEENPDLRVGSPTWGWLDAAFRAMPQGTDRKALAALDTPVLLLSAGEDQIVDNHSHEAVAKALKTCTTLKIRGARHELMMEMDAVRHQFWRAFDGFVA